MQNNWQRMLLLSVPVGLVQGAIIVGTALALYEFVGIDMLPALGIGGFVTLQIGLVLLLISARRQLAHYKALHANCTPTQ